MNIALSLAGVAVGVLILIANLRPWWKAGHDPKALLPFGSGWALGALATLCVGGALGWGARGIAGLAAKGGDSAVGALAGTSSAPVGASQMGALTAAGGVVVVVYLGYVVLLFKASGKADKRRVLGGIVVGAILGLLPGVAAMLDWLPDSVNGIGAWANGLVNGEVSL